MATNATTWFYQEPETGRPYLIAERVNHTFWNNRINDVYFVCESAEAPYRLVGDWGEQTVELEFEVNSVFILRMDAEDKPFIKGVREIIGFPPTVAYTDTDERYVVEWYAQNADQRVAELQSSGIQVKVYK